MLDINIQIDDPAAPDVRELLTQLDAFLNDLYPDEDNDPYLTPVDALRHPSVTFVTARHGDRPIGCGAVVNQNGEYAEVKRMFVLPEFRGQSIAHRILFELERIAVEAGLSIVRLETGSRQTGAIRCYEKAGYQRRGRYGDYPDCELSVYFEKSLNRPGTKPLSNTFPRRRAP